MTSWCRDVVYAACQGNRYYVNALYGAPLLTDADPTTAEGNPLVGCAFALAVRCCWRRIDRGWHTPRMELSLSAHGAALSGARGAGCFFSSFLLFIFIYFILFYFIFI